MFEIDTVQRAIEHYGAFELVDKISDTYEEVIELATKPELTDANLLSIDRGLQYLRSRQDFISELLERNQWLGEISGREQGSVLNAYLGVLMQIEEITVTA